MANHEHKTYSEALDVYMAFSRTKDGQEAKCMRVVSKDATDLEILKLRCKLAGGKWRIHKTVNKRDTEKARIWMIHKLIDFPDGGGFVDSLWRTALLQKENIYGDKKFLLDVDTKESDKLDAVRNLTEGNLIQEVETANGYHFITKAFDTREVCELKYVELIRDGYVYCETVYFPPNNCNLSKRDLC